MFGEGGVRNRQFRVDDAVFEKWDERSAYLFGVIASDGHVGKGINRNRVQITLSEKDLDWLKQLAKLFGFTGNFGSYDLKDTYAERRAVRFTFASPQITDRLRKLDVMVTGAFTQIRKPDD